MELFEKTKTKSFQKETTVKLHDRTNSRSISFIETQKSQIKSEAVKFQTQKNVNLFGKNNLQINESNTKSYSSTNIISNMNHNHQNKISISQTGKNDSKIDSNIGRRYKDIESSFNAEFDKSFQSIGKIDDKIISPIVGMKKIDLNKMKKSKAIESLRNDLKRWAFN